MIDSVAQAITTGITAFSATNLDDIVILTLFFAQINHQFRPRHIVFGQYLGFAGLVVASLPGFLGGLVLPRPWIGLLGLVPIVLGVRHWLTAAETESVQTVAIADLGLPIERSGRAYWMALRSPQTLQVAAVTFANGGDNIGIYVPLFASSSLASLVVILLTFFGLIAVWCAIAYGLTRHPLAVQALTRYGHRLVPFVLIGLGVAIVLDSRSYELLTPLMPVKGGR